MSQKAITRLVLLVCFTALTLFALVPTHDTAAAKATHFQSPPSPLPIVDFYVYPEEPAANIYTEFYSDAYDPLGYDIVEWFWDFGDGTTVTESYYPYAYHEYAADGEYVVFHTVTTADGRTNFAEKTITVRSHDVSIARVSRPNQARAGQTKRVVVQIGNSGYPTNVGVSLEKSVPGGFEPVGYLQQFVDVKSGNRPTKFLFSYTFTDADAEVGKVIFRVDAWPTGGFDAFPADNEFITYAVKVKERRGGNGTNAAEDAMVDAAALDDYSDYSTDTVSNQAVEFLETGVGTLAGVVEEITVEDGTAEEIRVEEEVSGKETEQLDYRQFLPSIFMEQ